MIIVTVTTYGFNPIDEYEAMHGFEAANDMKEWQKSESTQLVCYTHTERRAVTLPNVIEPLEMGKKEAEAERKRGKGGD